MELHPLASRFAEVADSYERARPDHPPAVVGAISAELGLRGGSSVLDLAAGTGKLTRALASSDLDVIAVEPQRELRERLAAASPGATVLAGFAEEIPLDDASVDAVTVADAFHWFDQQRAAAEIERVLRPGGGLAVIATLPDWSGASWADELGNLLNEVRPEHPFFDGPPWRDAIAAAGGWSEPRQIQVVVDRPARPDLMADYLGSMSFMAALPDDERRRAIERIEGLVASGTTPEVMPIRFVIGLASLSPRG